MPRLTFSEATDRHLADIEHRSTGRVCVGGSIGTIGCFAHQEHEAYAGMDEEHGAMIITTDSRLGSRLGCFDILGNISGAGHVKQIPNKLYGCNVGELQAVKKLQNLGNRPPWLESIDELTESIGSVIHHRLTDCAQAKEKSGLLCNTKVLALQILEENGPVLVFAENEDSTGYIVEANSVVLAPGSKPNKIEMDATVISSAEALTKQGREDVIRNTRGRLFVLGNASSTWSLIASLLLKERFDAHNIPPEMFTMTHVEIAELLRQYNGPEITVLQQSTDPHPRLAFDSVDEADSIKYKGPRCIDSTGAINKTLGVQQHLYGLTAKAVIAKKNSPVTFQRIANSGVHSMNCVQNQTLVDCTGFTPRIVPIYGPDGNRFPVAINKRSGSIDVTQVGQIKATNGQTLTPVFSNGIAGVPQTKLCEATSPPGNETAFIVGLLTAQKMGTKIYEEQNRLQHSKH